MKRMGSLNSSGDNADKSATDNDEIFSVNDYNKNIERNGQLDDIYKEIQVPLLLAVLYFLFQLPIFKKYLLYYH